MDPLQIDEATTINHLVPIVTQDGNLINPGNGQGPGVLSFYQIRNVSGSHIDEIDIVASIQVPSLQDLKNYRDAISEAIDKIEQPEDREP